jgi:hypothetical protein
MDYEVICDVVIPGIKSVIDEGICGIVPEFESIMPLSS